MLHFSMLHTGSHVAGIWDLRMPCLDSFLEPRHIDMSRLLSSLVCRHLQLHHGTLTAPSFRAPRAPTAVLLRKILCERRMVRNAQWPALWAKSLQNQLCTILKSIWEPYTGDYWCTDGEFWAKKLSDQTWAAEKTVCKLLVVRVQMANPHPKRYTKTD